MIFLFTLYVFVVFFFSALFSTFFNSFLSAFFSAFFNSFLFSGTESPLREALGVGLKDFAARQNLSSPTDLKYYIITAFALKNEEGREVRIPRYANWKLVPENVTDGFLAVDTVNFKFKL